MATNRKPTKKAAVKRQVSEKSPQQKNVDEIMARLIAEVSQSNSKAAPDFKVVQPIKSRPKIKLPVIQLPKLKTPVVRLPRIELPTIRLPKLKTPVVHLPRIELPTIRLPKLRVPARSMRVPVNPVSSRQSLPLVVVAAAVAVVIAGFWGPQIVRGLGIPIDPKPYTAVYFQDPTIVETGIVAGDLIIFGVHNGFRKERNLTWRMVSGSAPLARGQVTVNANEDSQLAASTSGAIPGELLKIYVEGTKAPITIQVVG